MKNATTAKQTGAGSSVLAGAASTENNTMNATTPKQNFPSPYGKVFHSLDPLWNKYGVMFKDKPTAWFNRKADAERALKTGDYSQSISPAA